MNGKQLDSGSVAAHKLLAMFGHPFEALMTSIGPHSKGFDHMFKAAMQNGSNLAAPGPLVQELHGESRAWRRAVSTVSR
jgi:hypothetical protein